MTSLDLSYNKLTGEYSHSHHEHDEDSFSNHTSVAINLHVNRLSGPLAHTSFEITRILNGNMFGCGFIPEEDEHSDTYACGKLQLTILGVYVNSVFIAA